MEYSFSTEWLTDPAPAGTPVPPRFGLGLHVRRRYDRVVNVERCHLQGEAGSEILCVVRELAAGSGLPVYTTRTHEGFWRFLVVREGRNTGERMVHLITHRAAPGSHEERAVDEVARALLARGPRITSLLHGIHAGKGSVATSESRRVLHGEPIIRESLLGLRFEIGPDTFFQTNTRGAEALFEEALRQAELESGHVVWDLYSGVGALSLPLARRAGQVTGFEIVPAAVEAARRNAEQNGIANASFLLGDSRELLAGTDRPTPDRVVVDPPREGVHPDVVQSLLSLRPPRIVYVSCNPATLARDLRLLVDGGYALVEVRPVDMFPHTAHIECVASLRRE
jgi:23S rRNA (uracil1939-C5)-methyltransferase